jgi:hypothetical protein
VSGDESAAIPLEDESSRASPFVFIEETQRALDWLVETEADDMKVRRGNHRRW